MVTGGVGNKASCRAEVIFQRKRICLTRGKRGIPEIDKIVITVLDCFKEKRANPFIVPAMGDHKGRSANGKKDFIPGEGMSEESMGFPIFAERIPKAEKCFLKKHRLYLDSE